MKPWKCENVLLMTWLNVTTQVTVCRSTSIAPLMLSDTGGPFAETEILKIIATKRQLKHKNTTLCEVKGREDTSGSQFTAGTNSPQLTHVAK